MIYKPQTFYLVVILSILICSCRDNSYTIEISNDTNIEKIIYVNIPGELQNKISNWGLQQSGQVIPSQQINDSIIIAKIPPTAIPLKLNFFEKNAPLVNNNQSDGRITVYNEENNPIYSYQYELACPGDSIGSIYCRNGFIHPLYTPEGKIVTDDFPAGHTHQHGFFSA